MCSLQSRAQRVSRDSELWVPSFKLTHYPYFRGIFGTGGISEENQEGPRRAMAQNLSDRSRERTLTAGPWPSYISNTCSMACIDLHIK